MKEPRTPLAHRARRQRFRAGLRHLAGLLWVMHLQRGALYALAVWVFGVIAAAAAQRPVDAWTLARLVLSVVCVQAAIAGVNDYYNRYLDAAGGRTGPLVRGMIHSWEALALPIALTAVMLVLLGTVGFLPIFLACAVLVLRLLCILYFRGSPVSAALYALSVPLIPLLAWSVFGRWQPFLAWLLPLGAAAGLGLYLASAVPELERETATGLRGLPHQLGSARTKLIACATLPLVLAIVWALNLASIVPTQGQALVAATAATLAATALAALLYLFRPTAGAAQASSVVQAIGAICLAAGWLAAVAL